MLFLFSSARKRASEGFGVALAMQHLCPWFANATFVPWIANATFVPMVCQCDICVVDCQCDICVVDCQFDICFVMKETIVVVIFCVGVLMVTVNNICG